MEDVIFSGTSNRPAKNISEVTLLIQNHDKNAPIQYNDLNEIIVKRRIEIKDFSKFLGSHGGILDRLDSMFFAAIIFQIYLVYFI